MSGPALVILAAGLGSRYGDAKQVEGIGPQGEWLLEYAIHDALGAGFTQVILVTRSDLHERLDARLAPHLRGRATLDFAEQSLDKIPAGCAVPADRIKPLGTGHALWCCASLLQGPFAVINADDYYGREAFHLLARHFRDHSRPALVGYRLAGTLSSHGGVNRGVCRVGVNGHLQDVTEFIDIAARDGVLTGIGPGGERRTLASDTVVSMNCWGLQPRLLPDLEDGLREFLPRADARSEYFLPHAVAAHLAKHGQSLAVLPTPDAWMGLTYPGDRAGTRAALASLHADGVYPTPLWIGA